MQRIHQGRVDGVRVVGVRRVEDQRADAGFAGGRQEFVLLGADARGVEHGPALGHAPRRDGERVPSGRDIGGRVDQHGSAVGGQARGMARLVGDVADLELVVRVVVQLGVLRLGLARRQRPGGLLVPSDGVDDGDAAGTCLQLAQHGRRLTGDHGRGIDEAADDESAFDEEIRNGPRRDRFDLLQRQLLVDRAVLVLAGRDEFGRVEYDAALAQGGDEFEVERGPLPHAQARVGQALVVAALDGDGV